MIRDFAALAASYILVASLGWLNGYLVGTFLERRLRRELDPWPARQTLDLREPAAAYDWDADPEIIWRAQ